jgi:hypothetical protein
MNCRDCVNRGPAGSSHSWCGPLARHVPRKGTQCGAVHFTPKNNRGMVSLGRKIVTEMKEGE